MSLRTGVNKVGTLALCYVMLCYDCTAGVQGLAELDRGGGAKLDCCPRAGVKLCRMHPLLVVAHHVPLHISYCITVLLYRMEKKKQIHDAIVEIHLHKLYL